MRKLLVVFVVLAILSIAVPATSATWTYYKGTGTRAWGSVPTVDPNGGWTITEPNGGSASEYGVLYTNIHVAGGTAASLSFDLNSINLPCLGGASGEGDGNLWTEVFIQNRTTMGNDQTAMDTFPATPGSGVARMTSVHLYNDYHNVNGGAQGWQSWYEWKNTTGGLHYLGLDSATPTGGWKVNDTHNITWSTSYSYGWIWIGIKTGVNNQGVANVSKNSTYGVNVSNFTLITPEPSSMLALGSGLFGLIGFAIRRRK